MQKAAVIVLSDPKSGAAASGFDLIVENAVPNTSGLPSLARLTDEGCAVMTF